MLFSAHRLGEDPHQPIAMSLCVREGDHLWGRYWGSTVEIDNLHFEVCYYAPIEWAIAQGIRHYDPGAGGSPSAAAVLWPARMPACTAGMSPSSPA